MSAGFLDVERQIIERLERKVQPLVRLVLPAADLAGVREAEQVTPALHVLYDGYRPTQHKGHGVIQEIEQRWVVVAAVRNVRDMDGAGAREDVGPIVDAVLRALLGWRPDAAHGPLVLAAAPRPGFSTGFYYFPLAFTTRLTMRGEP